jgi:hypothetical protein
MVPAVPNVAAVRRRGEKMIEDRKRLIDDAESGIETADWSMQNEKCKVKNRKLVAEICHWQFEIPSGARRYHD